MVAKHYALLFAALLFLGACHGVPKYSEGAVAKHEGVMEAERRA